MPPCTGKEMGKMWRRRKESSGEGRVEKEMNEKGRKVGRDGGLEGAALDRKKEAGKERCGEETAENEERKAGNDEKRGREGGRGKKRRASWKR